MPGVYGPGEQIIVKRTFAYINSFISSFFVLHKKDLKIDWIHVRNVIQAQTKVNMSINIANLRNFCYYIKRSLLFKRLETKICQIGTTISHELRKFQELLTYV